jgi:hypothetical protein
MIYNGVTEKFRNITNKVASDEAVSMLGSMKEELMSSKIIKHDPFIQQYLQKIDDMMKDNMFTGSELLAIKRDFDKILGHDIFNVQ